MTIADELIEKYEKAYGVEYCPIDQYTGDAEIVSKTKNTLVSCGGTDSTVVEIQDHGSGNKVYMSEGFSGRARIRFHGNDNLIVLESNARHINHVSATYWCSGSVLLFGEGSTSNGFHCVLGNNSSVVEIAKDCMLSSGIWIYTHDQHAVIDIDAKEQINIPEDDRYMKIGPHAWIGQDAMVINSASVGKGCIVGAKSLVNKSVQDFTAVGGVPAKLLRSNVTWARVSYINSPEKIGKLINKVQDMK